MKVVKTKTMSDDKLPKVIIYSDGGCSPNPGFGAWAALLMFKRGNGELVEKALTGYESRTTNSRMELIAAISALESLETSYAVDFYTDSQYLKNGVTQWLKNWVKNNWRTAPYQYLKDGNKHRMRSRPIENQDLWQRLDKVMQRHHITWNWVKGHGDDVYNKRVDKLVKKTRNDAKSNSDE